MGVIHTAVWVDGDGEIQFKYDPEPTDEIEPTRIEHPALSVDDATFEQVIAESDCEVVLGATDIEAPS